MRTKYKNPKELGTCLKDLVDAYLEDLLSEEKLREKVTKIVEVNGERAYQDGKIEAKIYPYLGAERAEIIYKIIENKEL
ncbi:TIGR04540 family protein [Caproiciproducens sp. MSJ-32]|uniref:TIGR04540 family protein n=1 Tax=Caproiciproducens sp. MSJ-32 TaxID=2841527 RepID=UPI001C103EA0|nr:TIGR04540 family protein [Caproiciproducens sp. MSJ-32]MBU5454495.1 TIGR04540 family protein [Caproiciproducens sp. MSJ-32]